MVKQERVIGIPKSTGVVYKIVNLVNNKIYFGITKCSIKKRWREHIHHSGRVKKNGHLYRAMRKYGKDNFVINVYKTCYSDEQMYSAEKYFIKTNNTTDRTIGYNNSIGGELSSLGAKHSEETRRLIGIKSKGHPPNKTSYKKGQYFPPKSAETKAKISASQKGKTISQEAIEKIKMALTGRKNGPMSEDCKRKIGESNRGKVRSIETRLRISLAKSGKESNRKGAKLSNETRQRIRLANIGKTQSADTVMKRSESLKKYWALKKLGVAC